MFTSMNQLLIRLPLVRVGAHFVPLTLCALLLVACGAQAAQFVEVTADIEVTNWHYQEETGLPLKNNRTFSVRCVVGTDTWLIERNSTTGPQESVWFMEGKII